MSPVICCDLQWRLTWPFVGLQIGINLADPMFRGKYYGVQRHPDDLSGVIKRAMETGCTKMIITGSDFKSIQGGLEISEEYGQSTPALITFIDR